ncbi:MAG: dihydroorotate dehydrogenase-like protein [Cyclobacteriaceae bacterium]|nr:dihydroorotate dehydrogenase-like protein [Cyclobacteriaceae bacterium]
MINLSANYMGLILKNPIVISSCSLSHSADGVKRLADAGAGAVVLKSLFEEQILSDTRKLELSAESVGHTEEIDYLRQMGMTQRSDEYLEMIEKAKEAVEIPIIASINCISDAAWTDYAKYIEAMGADGLELNIALMPKKFDENPQDIEERMYRIIEIVKHNINIPVAVKLGPYFTSIPRVATKVRKSGASALVLFNRFYQPDIDIQTFEFQSKNRYSSPAEMSNTLRWIAILYKKINCTLVANSGIHDGEAVVKQILAGASAVQICSTLYINGLSQIENMLFYLQEWMRRNEYASLDEFRGLISQKNAMQPEYFERQQYIRALVGVE